MNAPFKLPQNFQVGDAFKALNTDASNDNLADGIGQGFGIVSYKGKAWSLRYRGQTKQFVRPDDGTPASYIDVIILGSAKHKSKNYYPKFVQGQSEGERPICASMDGVTPDVGVTTKQAEACALCPRNEWRTDPTTGRKSRECQDYKRLAILIMPKISEALLGAPLLEPVYLKVPPDSLQAVAQMGDNMAKQGLHYSSYVTRISFDPAKSHPSMVFTPVQGLSNEEAPVILDMRKDPLVDRIVYGDAAMSGLAAVANVNRLAPAGHTPTGLMAAVRQAALPAPAPVSNVVPFQTVAPEAVPLVPNAAPVSSADVGVAELSDADLDARIAKMIASAK